MSVLSNPLVLPPDTRFEEGVSLRLLEHGAFLGMRGLLVCGGSLVRSGRLDPILERRVQGQEAHVWVHPGGEPTLRHVEALRDAARGYAPDWVAAVGGGSVLDVAKAAAGLIGAPLCIRDYHDGATIPASRMPFIAVPTTAGTGSEATAVSVLTNEDTGIKKSIRHPSHVARLVLLDSELLAGCPPEVIAASGMDALTQAIESFCSRGAVWFTDMLCCKAIVLLRDSLEAAFNGERDRFPELLSGSYLAGLALANARLGLVHGLAHPLGARYRAPHGLVCAVCLPHVLAFNRECIPDRYAQLGTLLGDDPERCAMSLLARLRLASPFAGKPAPDFDAVIEETLASGSTRANPRPVRPADVATLLERLFAAQ